MDLFIEFKSEPIYSSLNYKNYGIGLLSICDESTELSETMPVYSKIFTKPYTRL